MTKSDQMGFGAVGVLIVVAVTALFAGVGYIAWTNIDGQKQDKEGISTTDKASNDNEAPVLENASGDASQFDNAVMIDLQRILAGLNNYSANNNGRYPMSADEISNFEQRYLTDLSVHPVSELPYTLSETQDEDSENITYRQGTCSEDGTIEETTNNRQVALQIELPSGELYCTEN